MKISSTLITSSPSLITPLLVNALSDILAANVRHNIGRNFHFCYFVSFLIASLIPFTSTPDSSSNLIISIIPAISSFETINDEIVNDEFILNSCICCGNSC